MLDYLNTQEKEHLNALIALALENFVLEDDFDEEFHTLLNRKGWIAEALLDSGEPELAIEYMKSDALVNVNVHLSLSLTMAYAKSGNQEKSIEWEEKSFALLQQEPERNEEGYPNFSKHLGLSSLANNAFNRRDLQKRDQYLAPFCSKQHYYDHIALPLLQQLLRCGAVAQAREVICYLPPLRLSLTSTFSHLPILKELIAEGFELEFWALAGTFRPSHERDYNSIFMFGVDYAVELGNLPLAFRILEMEEPQSSELMDSFCRALIKHGQEPALKALLKRSHWSLSIQTNGYLQALATYARVGWKNDREFILEKTEPFLDSEHVIEDSEKLWIAQTFAWLNHWDGPITIESLNLIPKLNWEALVEPCIVHANQTLQDKLFEIAGNKDGWRCNLFLELHKSKRGLPNELEAHYYGMLDQMRREAGTWTWNSLIPVLWFLKHEWKDLSALEAFFTFAHEKGVNLSSRFLENHAFELAKAGRIADAIRHIPLIRSTYERLSAISSCISGYLDFKRRSSS